MSCEEQTLHPTDHCVKWGCHYMKLIKKGEFWVCPACGTSYGDDPLGAESSSARPSGYDANKLADWLTEQADREDESAELWRDHGCDEAINDRKRAIRFRRCAEIVRAAS